jgi:diguanylate cyclase (GGDEF)-like protein/PAS domain S-box-containing protein
MGKPPDRPRASTNTRSVRRKSAPVDPGAADPALIESEARFRVAFDQTAVGLAHVAVDGRYLQVNKKLCDILGYSAEELLQKTIWDVSHPEDREVATPHRQRLFAGEIDTFSLEKRFLQKGGGTVWVNLTVSLIRKAAGAPDYNIAAYEDISARKAAELKLVDTVSLLRATLESTTDGILVVDRSGHFATYNERFQSMWRNPDSVINSVNDEHALGDVLDQLANPDAFLQKLRELYDNPESDSFDVLEFKDGRVFERYSRPQRIDGSVVGRVWSFRDVSERRRAETALRLSEERFRGLIELSSDWYWEQDEQFRFSMVSDNFSRRMNPSETPAIGKTRWERPCLNMTEADWAAHRAVLNAHQPFYNLELLRLDGDGKPHYGSISGRPVFDTEGRFKGYLGVGVNVTARRLAEEALRGSEARYRSVVDNLAEGVIIIDTAGRIVSANPSAAHILGVSGEELLSGSLTDPRWRIFREDGTPWPEETRPTTVTLRTGEPRSNVVIGVLRPDSSLVWISINTRALGGSDRKPSEGVVISMSDVSERRNFEERLTFLAQTDTLTGLPNRALLRDRLAQALMRAKRHGMMVGVLLFDLDRFKEINDSLGHSAGDTVLKEVGVRVSRALRDTDTVARLGGDEFCIIIEDCDNRDKVAFTATKLQRLFDEPIPAESREIFTEASIGLAVYPEDGDSVEDLLKHADIAMYAAKHEGGNAYIFYSSDLHSKSADEIGMVAALRRAIDRNELVLHYQPRIEIKSGRPLGVEALVRWQHPELGMLSPLRFIHIAEETGLIVPIGEWVLKTACAEVKAWQQAGLGQLGMSVNLSARQFRDIGLVGKVAETLAATGLNPLFLELEITESVIMQQTDYTLRVLARLVDLGVRISIDDFGTGYSSLAYLKRFPVNKVKIDRAFVHDIHVNRDDAAIVKAIISLANTLDLGVIAEGVETREQLEYLAALGCQEYQGYYFSRPLPAAELIALLRSMSRAGPGSARSR